MGKGNRSRTLHATEIIENSAPKKNAEAKTNAIVWIVSIAVALLLIVSIGLNYVNSHGLIQRSKVAIKSDNYKISGTMLSYYVNSYYQQYYYSYASYFGITTGTALDAQYYDEDNDITWYDYFASALSTQLQQTLALCEGAKQAGVTLSADETASIESQIESLEETAASNLYTTSGYISAVFGTGVTESDVRTCMELSTLASKYYNQLLEEKKAALTDDEIQEYYDANPSKFLTADTLQYTFTATLTTADAEATEAETAQYEADKVSMLAKANSLEAAATSEDAFKSWVLDALCDETSLKELFDTNYETAAAELASDALPTDAQKTEAYNKIVEYIKAAAGNSDASAPDWGDAGYAEAFDAVCTNMYSSIITSGYNSVAVSDVTYVDPTDDEATDTEKWLFDSSRVAGDVTVITTEGDTTTTYTVIYVVSPAAADETLTRSVAHILVTGSTYGYDEDSDDEASSAALAKAQEILTEFQNGGDISVAAFKAIGEQYTEDSSVVYENVCEGDMVTEFNDWLFDEARIDKETGIVATDYGYHVMFYLGTGVPTWKANAISDLASEAISDWYDGAYDTFNVTVNTSIIKDTSAS